MKPEGSIPHSQSPSTWPCPEPNQSSPCTPSRFLRFHFNIIFPSRSVSSKWSLSFGSPPPKPYMHLPCSPYVPRATPFSFFLFDYANNIWWAVETTKPLVIYFSPLPCYLVRLRPKYLLGTNFGNIVSLRCPPQREGPSFWLSYTPTKWRWDSASLTKQRVTLLFGQTVSAFRHLSWFPANMYLHYYFPMISPWIRNNTVWQTLKCT